jgi:hypothetical protein
LGSGKQFFPNLNQAQGDINAIGLNTTLFEKGGVQPDDVYITLSLMASLPQGLN